jgi:hydroxymethylglutaryl-CoA synthase
MPCCKINQNIGNTYNGSVFSSLLSVICDQGDALVGKRVFMFSYGSGSVASMYSFIGRTPSSSTFSIGRIQATTDMFNRLASRRKCSYDEFVGALNLRQDKFGKAPMTPDGVMSDDSLFKGTYYLTVINDKYHRSYQQY